MGGMLDSNCGGRHPAGLLGAKREGHYNDGKIGAGQREFEATHAVWMPILHAHRFGSNRRADGLVGSRAKQVGGPSGRYRQRRGAPSIDVSTWAQSDRQFGCGATPCDMCAGVPEPSALAAQRYYDMSGHHMSAVAYVNQSGMEAMYEECGPIVEIPTQAFETQDIHYPNSEGIWQ